MAKKPSDKRDLIRLQAEGDLESFIRLVHPQRVLGAVHSELIRWWTREDAKSHQLTLLPRDHMKSALIAFRVAWEITKNPCVRVLYISSTANLAEKQLKFIKDILTSDIYTFYWPEMLHRDEGKREKWTSTEFSVDHPLRKAEAVRDPTVFTGGLTTTITGLHCDIAVLDDVVIRENAYTEDGRDKVKGQYSLLSSIEAGDGIGSLHVDNALEVYPTSARTGMLRFTIGTIFPKLYFTIPQRLPVGLDLIDGTGTTRNVILDYRGTGNGFQEDLGYYRKPIVAKTISAYWDDQFTEVLPVFDLSPDLVFADTVFKNADAETQIYAIRVSLQDTPFNASDASNHYAVVVSSDLRGLVSTSTYALYPASTSITITTEAAFKQLDAIISVGTTYFLTSQTKSDKLRISIRKVGTPPAISGIGRGNITVVYSTQ
jgi:hypothetical protein